MNADHIPADTAVPTANAAPTPRGDPATLRTIAAFARQRAEKLLHQARDTTALTNKRRLLASGAISELKHFADTLDGMAVKVEEGDGR